MSDVDSGAVVAAADTPHEAVIEQVATPPNPVSTAPVADPKPPEPPKSDAQKLDETLKASIEKATKAEGEKEAKTDAKPIDAKAKDGKEPTPRAEDGKFAPKEPAKAAVEPTEKPAAVEATPVRKSAYEAPKGLNAEERAEWDTWSEAAQKAYVRRDESANQFIEKNKAKIERDDGLAEFHDMAAKSGTDIKTALQRYTAMEGLLRQDVVKGLSAICENAGVSLRDVAAHVMGQTPDQAASQSDATIRELKQELANLKQQVGGVTQNIQQQREASTLKEIQTFAASKPRFDELAEDIAFFLKSGRTQDISEAYSLAERLNPSQAPVQVAAPAANGDQETRSLNGRKSIHGVPSAGAIAAARKPSSSIDESIQRAIAQVG